MKTVDWSNYRPFEPGINLSLHEVSREEAKAAFELLVNQKSQRIQALKALLSANDIELDDTESAIQELNNWFIKNIEASPIEQERLAPIWYSVVNDIALYLGDLLIERNGGLKWVFFTFDKKHLSYQRHVIMGFSKVKNPKFNLDIDLIIATHAHRLVKGIEDHRSSFLSLLHSAEELA